MRYIRLAKDILFVYHFGIKIHMYGGFNAGREASYKGRL
jgi:hypothetical protein